MNDATVRFRKPGDSDGGGTRLPADLLQKSRRRIRVVGLLVLLAAGLDSLLMLGSLVGRMLGRLGDEDLPGTLPMLANVLSVASAAGIVGAAWSRRIRDAQLLQFALGFEIFLCFVLSLSNAISGYETSGALPKLTWVTPLIIMFPLIVPCPPRRTVIIAVLAAATRPVGILLLSGTGQVRAGMSDILTAVFSPTIAVVIAYFGSRVVYGLGVEVAEARRMGSYELERLLGRGGMGEVWLGRHRMLARPAAVKLVRPDLLGHGQAEEMRQVLERFEREAQATAALCSPHTIDLYDFGVSEEGTFYYVMELLDGLDLDSFVRRFGPMPPERVVWILRQICHSLVEAHGAGLIHRDIKPANVYLCRYGDDSDFVKVLDFGLVKESRNSDDEATLAPQDVVGGTPAYMAPEQASGFENVDARSDLYAVGCLAYWLLTARPVFEGNRALEVVMHHVRTAPVPPSRRTEMAVPEDLERVVMACLEKSPQERPPNATALSDLLSHCAAANTWSNAQAHRWWETHRPRTQALSSRRLVDHVKVDRRAQHSPP